MLALTSHGKQVRGGLTFREGHYICEGASRLFALIVTPAHFSPFFPAAIAETGLLVSLDIMEINPSLGALQSVQQTVDIGRSLIRCALGETLL